MQTLKWILALAFVVGLFAASWNFLQVIHAFVVSINTEVDRSNVLPLLPGIEVTARLPIARGDRPSSSLWIVCAAGPQAKLALNTRLPDRYPEYRTYPGLDATLVVLTAGIRTMEMIKDAPRIDFAETILRRDAQNDVVLMPSLSTDELSVLSKAFLPLPPAVVRIDVFETGTEMSGVADGVAITKFADRCLSPSKGT